MESRVLYNKKNYFILNLIMLPKLHIIGYWSAVSSDETMTEL